MILNRKHIIHWLFEKTMLVYCKFKRKKAWGITTKELLEMPSHTFGYRLGQFLDIRGFQLIPKVERHDAYHLLTGFSTSVEDEIALQYTCFGNGKRTPYLFGVLIIGTLILPEYWKYYLQSYYFGKKTISFHHFDYQKVLQLDFQLFHDALFSETTLNEIRKFQHKINAQPSLKTATV